MTLNNYEISLDRLVRIWHLSVYKKFQRFFNFNNCKSSDIPIDVLIPATEKDLETLPYTIQSVRLYVRHPIINIFVIAPNSNKI